MIYTKLISLIISFLIFTSYVIYITIEFGWLPSISDSWYHLDRNQKWMYTLAMWGLAVPLAIAGSTLLTFLAAAGICFAGSAIDENHSKITDNVHVTGATGGIIVGTVSLFYDFHLWILALIVFSFSILTMELKMKNHTFWIEIVAYYIIWLGILINLL